MSTIHTLQMMNTPEKIDKVFAENLVNINAPYPSLIDPRVQITKLLELAAYGSAEAFAYVLRHGGDQSRRVTLASGHELDIFGMLALDGQRDRRERKLIMLNAQIQADQNQSLE